MSGEENPKQVNVDPQSIQEALRMYLHPIKNDDPKLDFYTMYKRETMEYDTENMNKYNEDLDITLIFAGLFSAVSSAFVIAVQSELRPDSNERSELYLRAILLTLNRTISPEEDPAAPTVWTGPSEEIITTLDLLYASLLMSLLSAFVAMLGKQWLNRYLRHSGGSTIERCGDRQRKFDGLEKWPFRLFIESLPIMLQIALFLLTCGLSRYMWSFNTSVARVVISFTVLGFLFYIAVVVAGTFSYDCPFQTPASAALRHLWGNGIARKALVRLTPSNVTLVMRTTQRNIYKLLSGRSLPSAAPLVYVAWINAWQGLVLAFNNVCEVIGHPSSWGVLLSRITSHIQGVIGQVLHHTIGLPRWVGRTLFGTQQRMARVFFGRSRIVTLLPTATKDVTAQLLVPQNLRVHVRNLEHIRRQNVDDARCVCWVLRNITDPEAIDSAIRLAGNIRWFDGDSAYEPPFDLIVSIFEACFDSTKRLYPGTRDRVYFSARAILRINAGARARSSDLASKYQIPDVSSDLLQQTDPDLCHIIYMLERNSGTRGPTLNFPEAGIHTTAHSLWMSNLFVDLTRAGPSSIVEYYHVCLSAVVTNHQTMIADVLLMWYVLLGGPVEEETFWATDKSDSLEPILSNLSTRVMVIITDGCCFEPLKYLLKFLAAWEKRPACMVQMAYQWCSAISEVAGRVSSGATLHDTTESNGSSEAGPDRYPPHSGEISCHTFENPQKPTHRDYADLLFISLRIGFRPVGPSCYDWSASHPTHISHWEQLFETAFSSDDDETIADAVSVWIVGGFYALPGSIVSYFIRRVERAGPFSQRLRWMGVRAIESISDRDFEVAGLEVFRLLDHLNVGMDDVVEEHAWARLLVSAIRSPTGPERLSPHYWWLLERLMLPAWILVELAARDMEVMRLLEETEDWEKLEVWMGFIWGCLIFSNGLTSTENDVEWATLQLLLDRPSALPRFEILGKPEGRPMYSDRHQERLQRICLQVKLALFWEFPPPLQPIQTQTFVHLLSAGDDAFWNRSSYSS